jgi:hypothetical protein
VETSSQDVSVYRIRHTLASRFAFLVICVAIVLSALAYGTVHYWALGLFNLGGLTILILWVLDAWRLGNLRVSRNALQLPLLGALVLGLVQLLPLRRSVQAAHAIGLSTLSLDPNSTRLVLVQLATLLIYFAATLVFVDTPHRLHRAGADDHGLWFSPRDLWIDAVVHQSDEGLLDSRAQPEHCVWSIYQSTPLRRLHGADDCVAVGFALCRRCR